MQSRNRIQLGIDVEKTKRRWNNTKSNMKEGNTSTREHSNWMNDYTLLWKRERERNTTQEEEEEEMNTNQTKAKSHALEYSKERNSKTSASHTRFSLVYAIQEYCGSSHFYPKSSQRAKSRYWTTTVHFSHPLKLSRKKISKRTSHSRREEALLPHHKSMAPGLLVLFFAHLHPNLLFHLIHV